jgi:hypothetical protein
MTPKEEKLTAAKNDIATMLGKVCDKHGLDASEALALCAYITGMCIAMQDQRTMTPDQAMELVIKNIQSGNRTAIEQVLSVNGKPQ